MRRFIIFAIFLLLTPALRAEVFELAFSVKTGTAPEGNLGFRGYWRFADRPEGGTIGTYECRQTFATTTINAQGVRWYSGDCTVLIKPDRRDTAETATFEILAGHAITKLSISGPNILAFAPTQATTPTISLTPNETGGTITVKTAAIYVEPNGFVGPCSYEYIFNRDGLGRNSCDGQPTYLPLGTTFQLFASGRDANPVHISHLGVPYPLGNGRVYQANTPTIGFRTINVQITPSQAVAWDLEKIPRSIGDVSGPDTMRLVQNNAYHLRANPADQSASRGVVFTLDDRCGAPAQRVFVPDYGVFFVEQLCGSERPSSAEASSAG